MDKQLHILGIPLDLGAGRRGVDMGPAAMRLAGLQEKVEELGYHLHDHGNVEVPIPQSVRAQQFLKYEQCSREGASSPLENAHYADAIITICNNAYQILRALPQDATRLVLGGDHAMSLASVAGMAHDAQGKPRGRVGVLWVDAHADLNTPKTSPSGNIHGMPVAALLGLEGTEPLAKVWGGGAVIRPEDVVYIGLRSVDEGEKAHLRTHGIRAYDTSAIDRQGIYQVIQESLEALAHTDRLHVSFDADVLDPRLAPGVGTPVEGGLTARETHLLMETLAHSGRVQSIDLVEVNPSLDSNNRTGEVMVSALLSLLGKTIL